MRIKFAILVAVAALSYQSFAESNARRAATAVQVRYLNVNSGIDSDAQNHINRILDREKNRQTLEYIKESAWGKDGEVTLCVQFIDFQNAYRVGQQIEDWVKTSKLSQFTEVKRILSCDPNDKPQPNE